MSMATTIDLIGAKREVKRLTAALTAAEAEIMQLQLHGYDQADELTRTVEALAAAEERTSFMEGARDRMLTYAERHKTALATARDDALEEAAKVADNHGNHNDDCAGCGEEIAATIRALKTEAKP
jgi:hypothetical protein